MKPKIKIVRMADMERDAYLCLLHDLNYHLASLYLAMEKGDNNERLNLLDNLYEIQQELNNLETINPKLKGYRNLAK